MPDFTVQNEGSLSLVRPMSKACRAWMEENVDPGSGLWGGAWVVEWRYVQGLVDGLLEAGFSS